MAKQAITVDQYLNPKFDDSQPADDAYTHGTNFRYVYRITKANNILHMKAPFNTPNGPTTTKVIDCGVGSQLSTHDVQDLIDKGVDVTIVGIKK